MRGHPPCRRDAVLIHPTRMRLTRPSLVRNQKRIINRLRQPAFETHAQPMLALRQPHLAAQRVPCPVLHITAMPTGDTRGIQSLDTQRFAVQLYLHLRKIFCPRRLRLRSLRPQRMHPPIHHITQCQPTFARLGHHKIKRQFISPRSDCRPPRGRGSVVILRGEPPVLVRLRFRRAHNLATRRFRLHQLAALRQGRPLRTPYCRGSLGHDSFPRR